MYGVATNYLTTWETPMEYVVTTNQSHSIQVSFLPQRLKFIVLYFYIVHRGAQRQNSQCCLDIQPGYDTMSAE
jgi:hypothetical protein